MGDDLRHPTELLGPCILLLLGERPGHGYELVERLKNIGFDGTSSPVYRELHRLAEAGFVNSVWQPPQSRGPSRRVYELTSSGHEALVRCAQTAGELIRALEDYRRRVRTVNRRARAASRREGEVGSDAPRGRRRPPFPAKDTPFG